MGAISLLEEAAGICLLSSLAATYRILQRKVEISLTNADQRKLLALSAHDPIQCALIIVNSWLAGRSEIEPTWRNILGFLRSIRYNTIAQQIENYFGVESVIVSSTPPIPSEAKTTVGEGMVCVHAEMAFSSKASYVVNSTLLHYLIDHSWRSRGGYGLQCIDLGHIGYPHYDLIAKGKA